MRTAIKYKLILAFSFLCLIGFVGQTIQLWRINDQLAQLTPETKTIPASIEERLLAELDKKNQPGASYPGTPFASFNQIQDYMDSFFAGFGPSPFAANTPFPRSSINFVSSALPDIVLDETENDYQIVIPVDPEQEIELSTNIEDNAVSVSGVITENRRQSLNSFASSFLSQRQFAKTVELPTPIDQFGMTTQQTAQGIRITTPKKNG